MRVFFDDTSEDAIYSIFTKIPMPGNDRSTSSMQTSLAVDVSISSLEGGSGDVISQHLSILQ